MLGVQLLPADLIFHDLEQLNTRLDTDITLSDSFRTKIQLTLYLHRSTILWTAKGFQLCQ